MFPGAPEGVRSVPTGIQDDTRRQILQGEDQGGHVSVMSAFAEFVPSVTDTLTVSE